MTVLAVIVAVLCLGVLVDLFFRARG